MTTESKEHLSRLMDGELSRETSLFLTRRLASDRSLCETWERYHLIRDCIRQPGSKVVVSGLQERLHESLSTEQPPGVSGWRVRRWLKPVSGIAIAASVALVAVFVAGPQPGGLPGTESVAPLAASPNQPFVSPNALPLVPASQPASFSAGGQGNIERLNAYLLRHNQMARTAGRQGFVSFVPIVATQSAEGEDLPEGDSGSEQDQPEQVTAPVQ